MSTDKKPTGNTITTVIITTVSTRNPQHDLYCLRFRTF